MSWVRIPPEAAHFSLGKKEFVSGVVVLYCVALYVVSFDHVQCTWYIYTMYMYLYIYNIHDTCTCTWEFVPQVTCSTH